MRWEAKNYHSSRRRREKALVFPLFLVFSLLVASALSVPAGDSLQEQKKLLLPGIWRCRGFIYAFEDDRKLRVERTGSTRQTVQGSYSWLRMAGHDCIVFRKNGSNVGDPEVYLIGTVTDSTAVIALGTPFVRADSSRGLSGLWKRMERYERVEWQFEANRVSFRKTGYDPDSGREQLIREWEGTYTRVQIPEPGSFAVEFAYGEAATVLPIVYRDIMYLYDLSPSKSLFIRERPPLVEEAPSPAGE